MHFIRDRSFWAISGTEDSLESLAFEQGYRFDGICGRLGCSARYLHAAFLRDIGLCPKRWLKAQRMVAARRMLEGNRTPAETAKLLGFANRSNFGREFLATYGVPPGKYFKEAQARRDRAN